MIFALRRPSIYTELSNPGVQWDRDGGPVELSIDLITASHALGVDRRATLKIGKVNVPLTRMETPSPINYEYIAVNTFRLVFTGEYRKQPTTPDKVRLSVRVKMSDGSSAKFRKTFKINSETQLS